MKDPQYPDALLTQRIQIAQEMFEGRTRMFFEQRDAYELVVDGNDNSIIRLPYPPASKVALTSVVIEEVGGSLTTLVATDWKVDIRNRLYPKLRRLVGVWSRGEANITITGSFGFVESDGSTPILVQRAVARLAIMFLPKLSDDDSIKTSRILEESIGNYRYKLADSFAKGVFGDEIVDQALRAYKPVAMAMV